MDRTYEVVVTLADGDMHTLHDVKYFERWPDQSCIKFEWDGGWTIYQLDKIVCYTAVVNKEEKHG